MAFSGHVAPGMQQTRSTMLLWMRLRTTLAYLLLQQIQLLAENATLFSQAGDDIALRYYVNVADADKREKRVKVHSGDDSAWRLALLAENAPLLVRQAMVSRLHYCVSLRIANGASINLGVQCPGCSKPDPRCGSGGG